jgi:asparagine synthase (glutamine-hydrolyzing)
MCSIAGMINIEKNKIQNILHKLNVMNDMQKHRGPDDIGTWVSQQEFIGFGHNRLSIFDLTDCGHQPMKDIETGNIVCFNGEIYNYIELREQIGGTFRTNTDTEVILKAFKKWGTDCVTHFKGMFAFAIWNEKDQTLFCARDRFGIKPFYYTIVDNIFYFASEMKALLPFLPDIETDMEGFKDYLTFQFCLGNHTLFKGIKELEPAHCVIIKNQKVKIERYWQVFYNLDWDHTEKYFIEKLDELIHNSIRYHIRSDVPIGGYVSGGVDSSVISAMAADIVGGDNYAGFTGKFSIGKLYDESMYAQAVACEHNFPLYQIDMTYTDFLKNIEKVIYYLDTPVAGPGSFCQYMVSGLAANHRKVVLGGQGGDEIFGGYTRYLVAYFEQCIKGAIEGTIDNQKYIVTYESIIPNLSALRNYKPMLKEFWSSGLFEESDRRYFKLINRAPMLYDCIHQEMLSDYDPYQKFHDIFYAENLKNTCYFDNMTHFDFKTLLPALLQVEDRMSMAHGLESRVPLLDDELIEFVATIPANFKLKAGDMKHIFKKSMSKYLPESIQKRKDKMGFPIPFNQWVKNEAKEFIYDTFYSKKALERQLIDNKKVFQKIETESDFGRNIWGLFCLELWQQTFHDRKCEYKNKLKERMINESI